MKKSELTEKPSRIPDISEQDITRKFEEYIEQIKTQNTESAKAQSSYPFRNPSAT